MTITRDQTATGQVGTASSFTVTWPANPAAGAKAILHVIAPGSSGLVTSVVDNGTTPRTYTRDFLFNGGGGDLMIYRADSITLPSAGSYHATITLSASSEVITGGRTYLGVAAGAPASTNDATGTSGTAATGNVTPAVGSLLAGGFANDSAQNPETITLTTSGASSVYVTNNGTVGIGGMADNIATATSAQGLTWTFGDTPDWGAYVALYSAAASAAGAPYLIAQNTGYF